MIFLGPLLIALIVGAMFFCLVFAVAPYLLSGGAGSREEAAACRPDPGRAADRGITIPDSTLTPP